MQYMRAVQQGNVKVAPKQECRGRPPFAGARGVLATLLPPCRRRRQKRTFKSTWLPGYVKGTTNRRWAAINRSLRPISLPPLATPGDRVFSLCYNVANVIGKGQGRRHCMPNTEKDKRPIVARITVGIFQENCYLYACPQTLEAVIIDPGDEAGRILERIEELKLIPKYILNTHGHID